MRLFKGNEKSTMVDISNDQLGAMYNSWVSDMGMAKALVQLSNEEFAKNVNIPEGQSVDEIRNSLKYKIKLIDPIIKEIEKNALNNGKK